MKTRLLALVLALLCLTGCGGGGSTRLTAPPGSRPTALQPLAKEDAAALSEFSLALLRENWTGENLLVSPLSALSALGMTANGAKGETLKQMETVLGLPAEELNQALAAWTAELPKEKDCRVDLANSLWIRDDGSFQAGEDFLKTAADWYGAEVFASPFDSGAVQEVNGWVEKNTHGMIPKIVDELREETVMLLVNALALEAEWEKIYQEYQVREDRIFTAGDGVKQPVTLMYSSEFRYLRDEGAQGFLKFYKGGRWAFAALLPEEDVGLEAYLASLTGEGLHEVLNNAEETPVLAAIPKFKGECAVTLNESLKAMGMTDAFESGLADLSGLGASEAGPLFISQVLHKTYIEVDERGTKAGAATAVAVSGGAGPEEESAPPPEVYLDRPFLYMLVDTGTNLPAFIGAVTDMS